MSTRIQTSGDPTARDRMRRMRERDSDIKIAPYTPSARRRRAEKTLKAFCRTYLRHMFPLPSSHDQDESIEKIDHATVSGGSYAQAAPRGDGKTQRSKAGALWAALSGRSRYLAAIGATGKLGKRLIIEITQELADNELLAEDYPEICLPIREAFARPNRSKYLTVNGAPARLECTTTKLVFPTIDGMPKGPAGCVIEGAGILEASRGLRHTTPDGETLRPELLIIDDFQTRGSAKSATQCQERLDIIRAGLKKMAAPDKALACICNCTVIVRGDAADQLLDPEKSPEWHGTRRKMVYEWPKRKDLWDHYAELRKDGMRRDDDGKEATAFYRKNRKAMDEGAKVGWIHRKRPGELSAIQCAYNILIDDGEEAFEAECQNNPISRSHSQYEITPQIVTSRVNGFARLTAPADVVGVCAAADVNYVGFNWVIMAGTSTGAAYVVAWGKAPEGRNLIDRKRATGFDTQKAIRDGGAELIKNMNDTVIMCGDRPRNIDLLLMDCGFEMDTIFAMCGSVRLPMRVLPVRGAPAQKYRVQKDCKRFGEGWHLANWERKGAVVVLDADYWQESTQRAFLAAPGTPGSMSLYQAPEREHRRYGDELCGERLVEHVRGQTGDFYKWAPTPGVRNDLLDATKYARAGLAALGMGGGGTAVAAQPQARRPRNSGVIQL